MKTVSELKDDVAGLLTGVDLNNVTNLNGALERAARNMSVKVDVPEATGRQTYQIYDGVFDQLAPSLIFGSAVIDFRPQGNSRTSLDYTYRKSISDFDRTKNYKFSGATLSFENRKGVKIMRVSDSRTRPRSMIEAMSDTTGWTAAGSASGLTVDSNVYYESPASLRFLLTGSSTGTLTKTLTQALDLSDYEDVGVAFLAIYAPNVTNLTSVQLKLGSSASAYNNVTATESFLGAFRIDEFLFVAFDFSGAAQTGTPDWSAIDYVQVSIAHTGTITNFRVGGLFIALGSPYELIYQTAAVFLTAAGALSNRITTDDDEITYGDAAYAIYEQECAKTITFQNGGTAQSGAIQEINNVLSDPQDGLYVHYKADNPSEEIRMIGNYYDDE